MMKRRRLIACAVWLFVATSFVASACAEDGRAATAQAAVGVWSGSVSWNEPVVFYSWAIEADGTFSSGREGHVHDGGGHWGVHGGRLTLKYDDGFRYEGDLRSGGYAGTAYRANGERFGTFSMSRVGDVDE